MPPGWYPDPDTEESRFWDGQVWSDGPAVQTGGPEPATPKPRSGRLESFALSPRVMVYLILAIVAGAFVYYVLLGGGPPPKH